MSLARRIENYDWDNLVDDVCHTVGDITGNVLSGKQRPMVESRMRRRVLDLQLKSPAEYSSYWQSNLASENKYLIGLITTHFTSFFREFSHFEWLALHLPSLVASAKAEGRSTLYFWSAACSKGQEVWSLCMWLDYYMPKIDSGMDWKVLGTDIDSTSVSDAENGVYHRRELETAPRHLWEGKWAKGKDDIANWYKIGSGLRKHASFQVINLLDIQLSKNLKFDVIMCRNVLIYFDKNNLEKISNKLLTLLSPAGVLITGVSESLNGHGLPIKCVGVSVYKSIHSSPTLELISTKAVIPQVRQVPKPLKVFCIDDSPTVLSILKKILSTNEFEIIGTASNGAEAIEKLKTLKPDVITLDLHMPVMDGPSFLKTSTVAIDIPVIVVSSVARDDDAMLDPLFSLGVSDFVEKPTLANMNKIGEELMQKLKTGWMTKNKKVSGPSQTNKLVKSTRPSGQILFSASENDLEAMILTLKQLVTTHDELIFILDETHFGHKLESHIPKTCKYNIVSVEDNFVMNLSLPTIWLNFKNSSGHAIRNKRLKNHWLISEESPALSKEIRSISDDLSPATSFPYLVNKLLSGS